MTRPLRDAPQFYLTSPTACPYLPGREERKVFTHLVGPKAGDLNNVLSQGGFRRSQSIAYRPACDGCSACVSVRIHAAAFEASRNQRRILKRGKDLARTEVAAEATREQFALLRTYLDSRHPGGGMSDMGLFDYVAMVEETPVNTHIVEYRTADGDQLWLMFEDDRLTRITASENGTHARTAQNVGVGSTDAAVRAAYRTVVEQGAHYDVPPAHNLIVWTVPDQTGLLFEVNGQGVVTAVHAGGPSILYMEGCA